MIGRRVYEDADGHLNLLPGDYCYWQRGKMWIGQCPAGASCNLSRHNVQEHEDGTITVKPSIRISGDQGIELWHGWLEKGVWRSC